MGKLDDCVTSWREDSDCFSAPTVGPEWNERQQSLFLLSPHHLHQTGDNMGLREFLRIPKINRRVRSKARSEVSSIGGPSDDNPVVPRPAASTPNLGIGGSSFPTPSLLTSAGQELKGMQTDVSIRVCLMTLFFHEIHRTFRSRSISIRFQRRAKQAIGIFKPHR